LHARRSPRRRPRKPTPARDVELPRCVGGRMLLPCSTT
jgi:hypothetical protein